MRKRNRVEDEMEVEVEVEAHQSSLPKKMVEQLNTREKEVSQERERKRGEF